MSPARREEDVTKRTNLKETRREDADWICLLQDRTSDEFLLTSGSMGGGVVLDYVSETGVHHTKLSYKN